VVSRDQELEPAGNGPTDWRGAAQGLQIVRLSSPPGDFTRRADHASVRAETVERLKEKYDRELAEEEDEKAMGRDFTTRLGPFVEVREI